jgi:hypothetical protein
MAAKDCIEEIERAAGRKFSDDELIELYNELGRRERHKKLLGGLDSDDEVVMKAAKEYGAELAKAAIIERRNAAINLQARIKMYDFIKTSFPDQPEVGLRALLVSTNKLARGAMSSAAASKFAKTNQYMAGFLSDIHKEGLTRTFTDGALDKDIARALFAINRKEEASVAHLPEDAVKTARIIAKWQDVTRADANRAGAYVGQIEGYMVRQSHDDFKIRAAKYEAWKASILPKLDQERTFQGANPDEFLKGVYQGLASGVHLRLGDDVGKLTGFKGASNLAKKASQERTLHFTDADSWYAYNQEFGLGTIREAVIKHFGISGQNTGVMLALGTNPEANISKIIEMIKNEKGIGIDKLRNFERFVKQGGELDRILATVLGHTNNSVNDLMATWGASARVVQNMAKLGGALPAQLGDLAARASEMKYQGHGGLLKNALDGFLDLFRGRRQDEYNEIYGMLGVYFDNVTGQMAAKFNMSDDGVPGALTKMQQLFFKLNGMSWWTDIQRSSSIVMFSHQLALRKDMGWDALSPELRRVLRQYSIEGNEWDVIRAGTTTSAADGKSFLTPEGLKNLPNSVFEDLIQKRGATPSKRKIEVTREELAQSLRMYFTDRGNYASISPDDHTRATLLRGSKPGTVEGELLRFIMQFKSFPAALMQRTLAREIYGKGSNTFAQALKNGNGEMLGLAQFMLMSTVFGYMSGVIKDFFKGKKPADPTLPTTWARAMAQGGAAGIYTDYLFGEAGKSKYGGNIISATAGPMAGSVANWVDVMNRIQSNVPGGKEQDFGASALRAIVTDTPYANLFYTRLAVDYLFLWQLQENLNPGSLKRMEKRVTEDTGQSFWLSPAKSVK